MIKSPHEEKLAEVREQVNTMFDATDDKDLLRGAMLGYFQTLHVDSVILGLKLGKESVMAILEGIEKDATKKQEMG